MSHKYCSIPHLQQKPIEVPVLALILDRCFKPDADRFNVSTNYGELYGKGDIPVGLVILVESEK